MTEETRDDQPTFTIRALEPGGASFSGSPHTVPAGVVQMMADAEYTDILDMIGELRQESDGTLRVDARQVQWAGPYEILLAITQVAETAGALAGGAGGILGGVAGLLALYTTKHPDKSIEVVLPTGARVKVTGDMDAETAAIINQMFETHAADLDSEEFKRYGPGTNAI